jgi:hypothetical protein
MKNLAKTILGAATSGLLAVGLFAAPAQAEAVVAKASACTKATQIEAIVDDSGSMLETDPNRLRVQAMDLLINSLDDTTALGAIEFGSSYEPAVPAADVVFPVEPVGPNAAAMKSALDAKIAGDSGSTDYNTAFETGQAAAPAAQARIFLTDGGHNQGPYNETHLKQNIPTYVIGFGPGLALTEDRDRLKKIAADTGGRYFPIDDSSQLQAAMNSVEAALTCQSAPREFVDTLDQGERKAHTLAIPASTKSIHIALTWSSPLDVFKISGLRLVGPKGVIAVAARRHKPRKLKVTRKTSTTFTLLDVSHLSKGVLHFSVKATKVGSGLPQATLTTQVSQSRRK